MKPICPNVYQVEGMKPSGSSRWTLGLKKPKKVGYAAGGRKNTKNIHIRLNLR